MNLIEHTSTYREIEYLESTGQFWREAERETAKAHGVTPETIEAIREAHPEPKWKNEVKPRNDQRETVAAGAMLSLVCVGGYFALLRAGMWLIDVMRRFM